MASIPPKSLVYKAPTNDRARPTFPHGQNDLLLGEIWIHHTKLAYEHKSALELVRRAS